MRMSRNAAEKLASQAEVALRAGNLDLSLELYRESLTLWIDLYKSSSDEKEKIDLYTVVHAHMMKAEHVKDLLDAQKTNSLATSTSSVSTPQPPPTPTPTPPRAPASSSKDAKKNPSAKASSALPDYHDYTAQKRSSKSASTPSGTPKPIRKASTIASSKPVQGDKEKQEAETSAAPNKSHRMDEYLEQIQDEIVDKSPAVSWDDIAGLQFAKQTLQEAVILPNLRPDLFTGLRSPPKGVLLFGPPGTGKTMLAKAVATESGFTFFSISAASVTSKYLGEGEKLMRALFEIARQKQPSVIFFDEIDALLSARKDSEHEASRRVKTEFMTQIDGAATSQSDRILIMGATNLPWDLDEAVLRRLPKRIYVPLPDNEARRSLVEHLLSKHGAAASQIGRADLDRIVQLTAGYSGSDLAAVCHEAALGPIREVDAAKLRTIRAEEVRPMALKDFTSAIQIIRPSVSNAHLQQFQKWAEEYGVTR